MEEFWKDIKGFEGLYQISSNGRVKCLERIRWNGNGWQTNKEIIKKTSLSDDGYPMTYLTLNKGSKKKFYIHRLIAEYFIDNPDNKPAVNHKDGIKTNNNLSNLEWVTHRENIQHAYDTGLMSNVGENHPGNKLTEIEVRDIKKRLLNGEGCTAISRDYEKITMHTIHKIKQGKCWGFVTV